MKIKGAIFDFDGTLFDSMPIWYNAGKEYLKMKGISRDDDVYIKIRVELVDECGNPTTFVMSFHFAEMAFVPEDFPYRK